MKKLPASPSKAKDVEGADAGFEEIVGLIQAARQRAYQAVNTELIDLYRRIGEHISRKITAAVWGDGVVERLAANITQPGLRGFTRPNLFRMRQFYEAYPAAAIVSALPRQLPWTHNVIILSQSKRPEEREFYLRMAVQERWSKRELERQFKTALFERVVLNPAKVSPVVRQSHPQSDGVFRDAYLVEYALSRTASPALIAEYQTQLPDKTLLHAKLHEFYLQNEAGKEEA